MVCTRYTQPCWPTHNHVLTLGCMPQFSSKWPPWWEAQIVNYLQISLTQPMSELKVQFALGLHLWNVLHLVWFIKFINRKGCSVYVHRPSFVCICLAVCIAISLRLCSIGLGCVHRATYIVFVPKTEGHLFIPPASTKLKGGYTGIRPWARGVHHAPPHIPTKLCFSKPSECPQ